MTKRIGRALSAFALLCAPATAQTTVIVDEGFESYVDQAAFKATWVPTLGNGTVPAAANDVDAGYLIGCVSCAPTTDPVNYPGIQGQAVDHIGANASQPGMVNQYDTDNNLATDPFHLNPSETQNIFLSADIFVGTSGNERMTVGLRSRTPANILEMGVFNVPTCDPTMVGCNPTSVPPPSDPTFLPSTGYAYRLILFDGFGGDLVAQPNWQYFELPIDLDRDADADQLVNVADIGAGWHTYTATIGMTEIILTIDLFRDGLRNSSITPDAITGIRPGTPGVDAEVTWQITTAPAGFNSLRIGGPSGLLSAGPGFMAFDNIRLALVPEPAALLLAGLCGVTALLLRRRFAVN